MRLVIFDVDGTLVDSQADIVASMAAAFDAQGRTALPREQVLSIVGLSLPEAIAQLAPDADAQEVAVMVDTYKANYMRLRAASDIKTASPLYPGIEEVLTTLAGEPETFLATATGKSRRGLDALFDGLGLFPFFDWIETADTHPSKPHPSMILSCLSHFGFNPDQAVMIGDTSFDMEMARSAGVKTIGVTWGYHPRERLLADSVVDTAAELLTAINHQLGAE